MMLRKKASTLIELTVYAALLLLVLSMAYGFYKFGWQYMSKTRGQVSLQQSAALAGTALVRDLCEAQSGGISSFPSPTSPGVPPGIVMLSARNDSGSFCYEPTSGYPIWQRYVGYYLDVDPEYPNVRALYRAEVTGRGGLPSNNPESPETAGVTTQFLRTNGVNRHLVAHGLRAESPGDLRGGLDAYCLNAANAKVYPPLLSNPVWVDLIFSNPSTGSKDNSMHTRLAVMARN